MEEYPSRQSSLHHNQVKCHYSCHRRRRTVTLLVDKDGRAFPRRRVALVSSFPAISRSSGRSSSLIQDSAATRIRGPPCTLVERCIASNRLATEFQIAEIQPKRHQEKLVSGCRAEFFRVILRQWTLACSHEDNNSYQSWDQHILREHARRAGVEHAEPAGDLSVSIRKMGVTAMATQGSNGSIILFDKSCCAPFVSLYMERISGPKSKTMALSESLH